jgi:hypothetical protein
MKSPYAPPSSPPETLGNERATHPKGLWILAYIIGIATLVLAGTLMLFADKLRTMEYQLGMSFSLLTKLLIRHRRFSSIILGVCGVLGILGSFLRSRPAMLALTTVAGIAAITLVILLGFAYLDFRGALPSLLH